MKHKDFDPNALVRQCREKMNGYRQKLVGRHLMNGSAAIERFEQVCTDFRRVATWYNTKHDSDEMIAAILQAKSDLMPLFGNDAIVQGVIDAIEMEVNTSRHFGGSER